ncbi:MAG: efflux RND transporter periplasmic adaptor subunit [Prevotella sp.]|nr:efflux RND transporter periplasmic adaptor subunit [Prevotella sp.]
MNKSKILWILSVVVLGLSACSEKKESARNVVEVRTRAASATSMTGQQSYSGTIEEMSGVALSFAGAGTIRSMAVHEGQHVNAGQLIGVIDAQTTGNAVAMAHATTQQAQESLRQAEDAYGRMKLLHDNGSLPEMKWVEVETKVAQARQMLAQARASEQIARKGLTDTRLTAPFSGYIARKQGEVGQNVMPGQPVVSLVKIDQVKVKLSVPEDEMSQLRVGQRVMFRVSSLGDATYFGTVSEKSVEADPVSRAYTVKAVVQNPGHRLLPGMVCDVYASVGQGEMGISLPANIIQIDVDNQPFVWTVRSGKAHKVSVVLGDNMGDNVIIKSGLSAGDQVIVEGQQKVSEGMKVKELRR